MIYICQEDGQGKHLAHKLTEEHFRGVLTADMIGKWLNTHIEYGFV